MVTFTASTQCYGGEEARGELETNTHTLALLHRRCQRIILLSGRFYNMFHNVFSLFTIDMESLSFYPLIKKLLYIGFKMNK